MPQSSSRAKGKGLLWPLVLAAIPVLVLAVGLVTGLRGEDSATPSNRGAPSAASDVSEQMRELGRSLARRDPADPMAMGARDAPVVLIVYSDYQCPYCGTWVTETQPKLVDRYVDSGELRIEWREFPYMGDASRTLAIGARAAAEQDRFWEYHQRVYEAQEGLKEAGASLEQRMTDIAAEAGLDRERFAADLESEKLATSVQEDFAEGQRLGVSGTPAFLVNGDPIMGAQPSSVFTSSIDDALAASEG